MKFTIRTLIRRLFLLIVIASFMQFMVAAVVSAEWAYRFVVYDGNIYVTSDVEVEKSQLNGKLGQVTKYSDIEGTYRGNFSNAFPKGTEYFEINGIDRLDAIAVKATDDTFIKAIYEGKYAVAEEHILNNERNLSEKGESDLSEGIEGDKLGFKIIVILFTILALLIVLSILYFREAMRRHH